MEISPFPHQGPLPPHQVRGRDDLIARLTEQLTARRVTALLGPRRYGKTSVMRNVAAALEDAGTSIVWVDLYELTSMADFAIRLDSALSNSRGSFRDLVERLAVSLQFTIGIAKLEFSKRQRPEPTATAHVLLDLLVDASANHPTVLILDEFSSADRVKGLTGLLRTKLQHHFDSVGLLFAGSLPSVMRGMFSQREQPFYGQADLIEIEPLSATTVHDLIHDGFTETGRAPGDLASRIYNFTGGHPHRTMLIADLAWDIAEPGAGPSGELWPATVRALADATDEACETLYLSLSATEQRVLRLLANGEPLHGRAAEVLGLNPTPARRGTARLHESGHLDKGDLVDPVLYDWIRRRFPGAGHRAALDLPP